MLYLVIAKDSAGPDTPSRRQAVRPTHIEELASAVESGQVKLAGAILGDDDTAVGSALLIEADDEAAARKLLEQDIYTREGVWASFEIHPFKQAF